MSAPTPFATPKARVEDLLIRFGALARELAPQLPAPAAAPLLQELSRLLQELPAVDATSHRYTLLRDLRVRTQRAMAPLLLRVAEWCCRPAEPLRHKPTASRPSALGRCSDLSQNFYALGPVASRSAHSATSSAIYQISLVSYMPLAHFFLRLILRRRSCALSGNI